MAWHLKDAVYLNARGVSFAILTTGRWDEVASYIEFMGYTQPWYSVCDVDAPVGGEMGLYHLLPARRRPRVPHLLHDGPPRGLGGQPRGLARGPSGRLVARWTRLADLLVLALGRERERHLGSDQPPRAAVDPPRRDPRGDPRPARPPSLTRLSYQGSGCTYRGSHGVGRLRHAEMPLGSCQAAGRYGGIGRTGRRRGPDQ
jgi:hypothetical protein